jgi:hypothetical protein
MLEICLETTELRSEDIVGAADNNVGCLISTLHDLLPGFVDLSESGGILRQGFSDISFSEHSHERLPETLDLKPFLNGFRNRREDADFLSNLILEGSNISHDSHLIELVNVVFNFSLHIGNISTDGRGDTIVTVNSELTGIIMGNDIISELVL